ncbi:hypothetical protein [Clostridium beijerinckii]|uniref:hypothetical protein n=1 Tax=Clostridium beijerinckii TaxID=1520 RepID=UPI001494134D|nr:hypothetical protein [Clostridium beijerinckii]
MKVGQILRENQEDVYKQLNSKPKKRRRRRKKKRDTNSLSFSDVESLMRHDSYTRGKGGAIKQKTWGNS